MVQTKDNAELFQQTYKVLRDLASMLLSRERKDHTLQPTALVNEAFLKMEHGARGTTEKPLWANKTHFQAIAARAMRQILVDYSRQRAAQKRGGDWQRVTMSGGLIRDNADVDFEALDEALKRLSKMDERKGQVVEMRFFGGMTCNEIGGELGISPRTVESDWYFARAWLRKQLSEQSDE